MKHRFFYIYTAFIVSLSILVTLALLFSRQMEFMLKYNRSVENTYKGLYQIESLNNYINQLESGARGYMLTRDSVYLKPFTNHQAIIKNVIDSLNAKMSDDIKQHNKLSLLYSTIKLRLSVLYQLVDKARLQDSSGLGALLFKSKSIMDTLQEEIKELESGELRMLKIDFEKKSFYEKYAPGYLKFVLVFTSFITVVSFFFLNRALRQRLKYQKELENKVDELHRSNEELEQIANVASHELQEPLRKIRTFGSRLLMKHGAGLNEEVKLIVSRIDASANRMHELMHDVVTFTNLIHSSEQLSVVKLSTILDNVLKDISSEIESKKALVVYEVLPAVEGYPKQLHILFKCLLDNSLKFSKEAITPKISISVSKIQIKNRLYHMVSVSDNGIGFDNEFERKIFILFQRLHAQQSRYPGKGIGLAIVKRIIVNHKGIVKARGQSGNGAVFELYFPTLPADMS